MRCEMRDKGKMQLIWKCVIILFICLVDILWGAGFIYKWKQDGSVLSVRNASGNLPGIFAQNLIVAAVPIAIFLIALFILRGKFVTEMYFKVYGKKQWGAVCILTVVLAVMTIFCLVTKEDKITVLYNLLYYTVFIALTEEFVVRDVCVWFLREEHKAVRYLVPNVLFAAMHLFSYSGWGNITVSYVLSFVTSQMLGLVAMGCLFQFLKEKSGSIWIPVLVHAALDYAVVFGY